MITLTTTKKKKHVIIIGAGPSGLVAMKEMLHKGHDVTCLEQSQYIGGAFAQDKVYDTLYLTISNLLMAFSDYIPQDHSSTLSYSSATEYLSYLQSYTTHFQLWDHIQFNTQVIHATLDKTTKQWVITTKTTTKPSTTGNTPPAVETTVKYTSDILIVATGANHIPKTIDLPGYTGQVSHSVDYRDASKFKDQNVLVIGVGESSSDIANDISKVAKSCSVYTRRYIVLGPRYLSIVHDTNYNEETLLHTSSKRQDKINTFLESITTNRLSGWLPCWYFGYIRQLIWKPTKGVTPFTLIADWSRYASSTQGYYFRADQAGVVTKNSSLSVAHGDHRINTIVSKSIQFEQRKVIFPNTVWYNKSMESECVTSLDNIDHIVLCTGYQTNFTWLDIENFDSNPRSWYKHCFPSGEIGNQLMFLGWTRPHQGGIPACSEILSRYIAMIINEECQLPMNHGEIAKVEGHIETTYYSYHPNVSVLVDLPAFMESIATLIGCMPQCPPIYKIERFIQYWLYPSWSCWYRQCGPDAQPEVLESVLQSMPLIQYFDMDVPTILGIPMALLSYTSSVMIRCIPIVSYYYCKSGLWNGFYIFRPRKHVLHGNDMIPIPMSIQILLCSGIIYYVRQYLF